MKPDVHISGQTPVAQPFLFALLALSNEGSFEGAVRRKHRLDLPLLGLVPTS